MGAAKVIGGFGVAAVEDLVPVAVDELLLELVDEVAQRAVALGIGRDDLVDVVDHHHVVALDQFVLLRLDGLAHPVAVDRLVGHRYADETTALGRPVAGRVVEDVEVFRLKNCP